MTRNRMAVVMLAAMWASAFVAQGQGERPDGISRDETARVLPTAASVAIWTDRPGYRKWRDLIHVYLTTDPNGDRRPFHELVFLENIETGQRKYLVSKKESRWLQEEIVDLSGRDPRWLGGERIAHRPPARIWTGRALEPGLWQFVAELRSPDTTEVVKSAHAKFVVSPRSPQKVGTEGTQQGDCDRHDMVERLDPRDPWTGIRQCGCHIDDRARHARACKRAGGLHRGRERWPDHGGRAPGRANRDDLR